MKVGNFSIFYFEYGVFVYFVYFKYEIYVDNVIILDL